MSTTQDLDSNVLEVISVLQGTDPTKAEIIERAESAPLEVSVELRGNGEGEAGIALDLGWNSVKGSARVVVSGRIKCDSHPTTQLKAYAHIGAVVRSVMAEELVKLKQVMEAMSKVDVGD